MLPVHLIEVTDTDTFKTELQSLFYLHNLYDYIKPEYTSRADCPVIDNKINK